MLHCALTEKSCITPELRLWAAVLLKAIKDEQGVNNPKAHVRRSATTFLTSGDADWICGLLGLNVAKINQMIRMGLPCGTTIE